MEELCDNVIIASYELRFGIETGVLCPYNYYGCFDEVDYRGIGVEAAVYTSKTTKRDRATALAAFKGGDLKVLCAVDVLNEGADLPFVECLLFLRPTESKRIFYQQLGRGLRKSPGTPHCLVIDFIGNFKNAHKVIAYQGLLPFESDDEFDYHRAEAGEARVRAAEVPPQGQP